MKTTVNFLKSFLLLFLIWCNTIPQVIEGQGRYEKYKNDIVKIRTTFPDRPAETGAGIIISKDENYTIILTALHVIAPPEASKKSVENRKIEVMFRFNSTWVTAEATGKVDKKLDMAVLKVYISNPSFTKKAGKIKLGNAYKVKIDQPVATIGHPGITDWKLSQGELKSIDADQLHFDDNSIAPGNSGGPLFNKQSDLVGMVININPETNNGVAININVAQKVINSWQNVPFDLEPRKVRYWGYAAGTLAVTGITFKILSDTKYNQYQNSTDNGEAQRLKNKVETYDIIYPIALAGSAICLTKYLLSSRVKKPKKERSNHLYPST